MEKKYEGSVPIIIGEETEYFKWEEFYGVKPIAR